VAGPRSRDMLQRLTNADLSTGAFPFMRSQHIELAGIKLIAIRVSFTGDLGWELHCATEDQEALYAALLDAGKEFDVGPVGSRALMSLRIEKGYGSWSREYSPEYWPQEVGLDRLIKTEKEFLNKDAYLALKDNPPRELLCIMEIEVGTADATGGEPIFLPDGTPVGRVSSGAYGYSVDKSLALGFIKTHQAEPGTELEVYILGQPHPAKILKDPPFDPSGQKLRA
jgi:dimethylglycine dehydrogenase